MWSAGNKDFYMKLGNNVDSSLFGYIYWDSHGNWSTSGLELTLLVGSLSNENTATTVVKLSKRGVAKFSGLMVPGNNFRYHDSIFVWTGSERRNWYKDIKNATHYQYFSTSGECPCF